MALVISAIKLLILSQPLATSNPFSVPKILSFPKCRTNGIRQQTEFWLCLKYSGSGFCVNMSFGRKAMKKKSLGRKAVTNLDSVLKSRDNTLSTKIHVVKAMFFSTVMYGYESWSIGKLSAEELMLLNCDVGEDPWESLDYMEIKPVHPKGNQSWIFIGRTDAEAETRNFGHLMGRIDSLEKILMLGKIKGRRRRGRQKMRWLDGVTDLRDMSFSKLRWCIGSLACCSPWSHRVGHDWATGLDWTEHDYLNRLKKRP